MTEVEVAALRDEITRMRRAIRTAIYGVLLAVLAVLVVGLGNIVYTNRVDERRAHAAEQVEAARSAVAEQNRMLVCSLALAQAEALRDTETEPGRKSLAAWQAMATRFNCR